MTPARDHPAWQPAAIAAIVTLVAGVKDHSPALPLAGLAIGLFVLVYAAVRAIHRRL